MNCEFIPIEQPNADGKRRWACSRCWVTTAPTIFSGDRIHAQCGARTSCCPDVHWPNDWPEQLYLSHIARRETWILDRDSRRLVPTYTLPEHGILRCVNESWFLIEEQTEPVRLTMYSCDPLHLVCDELCEVTL